MGPSECLWFHGHLGYSVCWPGLPIARYNVLLESLLELIRNVVTFECDGFFSVFVNGGNRPFTVSRQTDADVSMTTFAWSVNHAPHYRYGQLLNARVDALPSWHA